MHYISKKFNTYPEVKSIDERLSFLEDKLQHYRKGQESDSISQRRNQTLPAQSLNTITQNRNRKIVSQVYNFELLVEMILKLC